MNFENFYKILSNNPNFTFLRIISHRNDKEFTYNDLKESIHKFISLYEKKKINEGDLVVIILKESLDLFGSFIAAILHGATPAFYAYPSPKQLPDLFIERFNDLAANNNIKLLLGFEEVCNLLNQNSNENNYKIVDVNNITYDENFAINIQNKNKSFVQFSSGTTAHKKGIEISELSLLNQVKSYSKHVQFHEKSKVASWLPHYHDMGLIACMLMPLLEQIEILMFSPFEWVANPGEFLRKVDEHKCTHTWQPNFALGHMVKSIPFADVKNYDLSSLEYIACSSEPVLHETVNNFLNHFEHAKISKLSLQNCYGMAENTIYMSASKNRVMTFLSIDYEEFKNKSEIIEKDNGYKIASVGAPLENNYMSIFDDENKEIKDGKIGNIFIKSNSLFEGYYNNKKLTDESFYDGWFKTGDLGFKYNEEFYVTGRKKEIIIVGGQNLYPQDIESIINNSEGCIKGRNVAFGINDKRIGTEKIVIVVEIWDMKKNLIDTDAIKKKIFNTLNVAISDILLVPHKSLAKSTAGKISRYLNKEKYLNGEFDKFKNTSSTTTSIENKTLKLLDIIKRVSINQENYNINKDTHLFNNGIIDSFGFIDLISEVEIEFETKVPEVLQDYDYFSTINNIINTLNDINSGKAYTNKINIDENHEMSMSNLDFNNDIKSQIYQTNSKTEERSKDSHYNRFKKFFIKVILLFNFIIPNFICIYLLNKSGIEIGKKSSIGNGSEFKIRGKLSNVKIGENVKIGKNFSLRNRENGQIIIHKNCYIDDDVRIIAARNGIVEISEGTSIGRNTIINSGGEFKCGKFCLIGSNTNINTSEHANLSSKYIKMQPYKHGKIHLDDDVFIGSGVSILMNTLLRKGVIISSNSLISGDTQSFSVYAGNPAKFIRKR
jgi:fatty-acyl-CoA synthase